MGKLSIFRFFVIPLLLLCVTGNGFPAEEDYMASNGFIYSINGDQSITITGYNGSSEDMVIPQMIEGRQVTAIGPRAFTGDSDGHRVIYGRITTLVLPDGLVSIGEDAFAVNRIEELKIPEGVTRIGVYSGKKDPPVHEDRSRSPKERSTP
jgi:hypothetical protein